VTTLENANILIEQKNKEFDCEFNAIRQTNADHERVASDLQDELKAMRDHANNLEASRSPRGLAEA
jgi:hypothetical protein